MGKHNLHIKNRITVEVEFFAAGVAEANKCLEDIEREVYRVAHRKVLEKRFEVCDVKARLV